MTIAVGDIDGSDGHAVRQVVYTGDVYDLLELEDILVSLADQAAVALQRIELTARVRTSEREQSVLAYRASHDGLTGLPNADQFRSELRLASLTVHADSIIAVLFIDLDDFKSINDTLGHSAGDAVLVVASQRIRAALRHGDLGARLGGDEFAVILRGLANTAAADAVTSRLTEALAQPTVIGNIPIVSRASIGLAVCNKPEDASTLLRRADAALYAAKAAGKGRWRSYDPFMRSPLRRGSDLRADLEQALAFKPSGKVPSPADLSMHYQPIVALVSEEVRGFEALIRWDHPEFGMIDVPELIGLAEQTGLILPLGDWVLSQAFGDGLRLTASGDRYVAINVSVAQLRLDGFIDRIREHLTSSGIKPDHVVIEVTESQLVTDDEQIWADLAELRRCGVRVAIDDYGTGYASLSYLRHPVIDVVKLDRGFVENIASERNQMLIRALLNLTIELDVQLIVEGIEDQDTRTTLVELGCEYGQGHLFARAMPLERALAYQPAIGADRR